MLERHHGQDRGQLGTYVNIHTGELISITEEVTTLPGDRETTYLKAPLPLMMVLGPVLGLIFILFLPLSGIAVICNFAISLLRYKTVAGIATARSTAIQMAAPRRYPGVSYLYEGNSRPSSARQTRIMESGSVIDSLEREIEERRLHGEK